MAKPTSRMGVVSEARGVKDHRLVHLAGEDPQLLDGTDGKRISFYVYNGSGSTIYIGQQMVTVADADVPLTAANGVPIAAGNDFADLESYDAWYAVPADGAAVDIVVITVSTDERP